MTPEKARWFLLGFLLGLLFAMWTAPALACTGYLTGEEVITIKKGGYSRTVRLCYYDHLGDPLMVTVPSHSFCRTMINVPHPGEDRDGNGEDDGEEN